MNTTNRSLPTSTNTSATTRRNETGSDEKGTFTLLLFASAQSYADDIESLILPAPMTLRQLFEELERRYPGIGAKILKSSGMSVNLEYVDFVYEDVLEKDGKDENLVVIQNGDEVGIIPPVSSG